MGTRKMFLFNTHVDLVNKGSVNEFLYKKMVLFGGSFWFSVYTNMLYLFKLINRYLFRFQGDESSLEDDSSSSVIICQKDNQTVSNCIEPEHEPEIIDFENSEYDGFDEKETPKFCFKFQFPPFEDTSRSNGESEDFVSPEKSPNTSTSKYQFMSAGKDFSGFVEEPEVVNFTVKELYVGSNNGFFSNKEILDDRFLPDKDFLQFNSETGAHEEIPENSTDSLSRGDDSKKPEPIKFTEDQLPEKEQLASLGSNFPSKHDISDDVQFISDNNLFALDSDPESISLSDDCSVRNHLTDSNTDEFLSERDFGGFEPDTLMDMDEEKVELIEDILRPDDTQLQNSSTLDTEEFNINSGSPSVWSSFGHELKDFDGEELELVEELEISEEPHLQNSPIFEDEDKFKQEDFCGEDTEPIRLENSEEPNLQSQSWDSDDPNELETLWEHQDLIEQLKMEIRKVRATGLPTILEESECPKMMEDLKPWKIDEKFLHKDRIDELDKFYKSYRERMRKFDILNYQKMYAIGFLQLKDPLQSISSRKSSNPGIKSLFLQNFRLHKRRKPEADTTTKFIRELQSDLETVYVGQVCLSWEFLHWQYKKVEELQESDPHGFCQYNQVAGEFQQFQVLMQRFLENEPFQGPRVQNYVKNRCLLRNLLHVPVIKDDYFRDKKKGRRKVAGKDAITSEMLIEMIEDSIRIFWRFLRADKDATTAILKGHGGNPVELQDPADSELLMDIRTNLQKKEKRLKDILRSGNCIVKKFQKHQDDGLDPDLCFFSQIDMKLVSRVLNMSRLTTDQLVWCHKKLNKISFIDRKLCVEPSFLLFPC
ncbi:hypothetical protein HHK36_024732 [Tetracentron sinense]|uniref:Uncharacterized protein n=1 Tax=Tetracentron sinense TaxID=13715 RepID=A0A834YNM4_TETSI|nr:hypothetical protein HHK36_024732 [Tetracentron sinense]